MPPPLRPGPLVTLVEGVAFAISEASGDILPDAAEGLFYRSSRLLSTFQLLVNGTAPEPLSALSDEPFTATFVGRVRGAAPATDAAGTALVVVRRRYLGQGLREDLVIRNYGDEAAYCEVEVRFAADFADLADVRDGRAAGPPATVTVDERGVHFSPHGGDRRRGALLESCGEPILEADRARFETIVPARGEWQTCLQLSPVIGGEELVPRYRCGDPVERSTPAERWQKWRRGLPVVETDHEGLRRTVARGGDDLGALRIFDPERPERAVVAAGVPWAMTVYGRDSLLTGWMALLLDPDLALGVVETLARFQGTDVDPRTEEEPGRILHELRFGATSPLSLGGGTISYCSVDATPLFVMLLGELRRWGLAPEAVDRLMPHADRALAWIDDFGDRDGDGYVEYQRATDRGLLHQGWKDTPDAIRFGDGRLARPAIALCEVQGYVYAAWLARAHFAEEAGDPALATSYRTRAADLRTRFNRDFWLEDRGWLAVGLDVDKDPIDALASNMGHCLWTGILDEDKAALVAEQLLSPELFSGWGVRTRASSMAAFNPLSYHSGSVWPHDNAIAAAGLMRYGHVEAAHRLILAQLEAARAFGFRLPELFSGLERAEFGAPIGIPSACAPQAWSAAAPLLLLRTMLRLEPWMPQRKLWLAPALPPEIGHLRIERIPLLGGRVTVDVDGDAVKIEGLPPDIELLDAPRAPLTSR